MKKYEEYQLQWMIEHGHSIDELIDELEHVREMLEVEKEENEIINMITVYEVWHDCFGFNSELWACKSEWEHNEQL